jgi:ABC-type dipeptide/oligopeptide/nickel transport system permease subunit
MSGATETTAEDAVGTETPPSESPVESRTRAPSRARDIGRRIVANPTGKIAVGLLGVLVFLAVFAPWLAPADPVSQSLNSTDTPPSWLGGEGGGLLGGDPLGRDVLSRILYGLRLSLIIGVVTASATAVLGLALGLLAGYFEKVLGTALMRLADIQFSVPFIAVGIAVAAALGAGVQNLIIILAVWGWTIHARTIYSSVLQTKQLDFITAVKTSGAGTSRILFKHILPNVVGPVIILWSNSAGVIILAESALSLLGIGVQAPDFSLGSMLADSQTTLRTAWWAAVFPGAAIALAVIGFNLLGDALRDAFNPNLADMAKHDPDLS